MKPELYRLAQAGRLIRLFKDGASEAEYAAALGPDGKVVPELVDLVAAVAELRARI